MHLGEIVESARFFTYVVPQMVEAYFKACIAGSHETQPGFQELLQGIEKLLATYVGFFLFANRVTRGTREIFGLRHAGEAGWDAKYRGAVNIAASFMILSAEAATLRLNEAVMTGEMDGALGFPEGASYRAFEIWTKAIHSIPTLFYEWAECKIRAGEAESARAPRAEQRILKLKRDSLEQKLQEKYFYNPKRVETFLFPAMISSIHQAMDIGAHVLQGIDGLRAEFQRDISENAEQLKNPDVMRKHELAREYGKNPENYFTRERTLQILKGYGLEAVMAVIPESNFVFDREQ